MLWQRRYDQNSKDIFLIALLSYYGGILTIIYVLPGDETINENLVWSAWIIKIRIPAGKQAHRRQYTALSFYLSINIYIKRQRNRITSSITSRYTRETYISAHWTWRYGKQW